MSPSTPRKHRHMDATTFMAVGNFLKEVIRRVEGTPFAEYVSPWNDESVAQKFGATKANVAGLRERLFGKLRPHSSDVTLHQRFNLLQKRFVALEEWAVSAGYQTPKD